MNAWRSTAGSPTPAATGRADFSWFIPATRAWRVYESSRAGVESLPRIVFGASADRPVTASRAAW